jgi:hypothetical protein
MTLQALEAPRFVRRTRLGPNEYRKNFRQIDCEVLAAVTSAEAHRVTPLMSKIYLRLVNAPQKYWEGDGVLRIKAEVRGEKLVKAWAVLCELVGAASATSSKALRWMHGQGIIGYFSGKNGVGLRIFLNRASSSIGVRPEQGGKKILAFSPASPEGVRASANEPAFSDSYAVRETSDTGINSRAPKNGADIERVGISSTDPIQATSSATSHGGTANATPPLISGALPVEDLITRLKAGLEPTIHAAAKLAAAREHERTREWLESRGLPKAARVAQHEAYNVLRKYGLIDGGGRVSRPQAEVGRGGHTPSDPSPLSGTEVDELAQACVAMLETQGRPVERTLSEMSSEGGGFLLPEDAARVRARADSLLRAGRGEQGA